MNMDRFSEFRDQPIRVREEDSMRDDRWMDDDFEARCQPAGFDLPSPQLPERRASDLKESDL